MRSLRYLFSPASNADMPCFLVMGMVTGLLALIPYVGWLLGLSLFMLWQKSRDSTLFTLELPLLMLLWLAVKVATLGMM